MPAATVFTAPPINGGVKSLEGNELMRHEIHLDVDDWAVLRLAQLRQDGETAQLHAVIDEDRRVTDLFIVREDGSIERSPRGQQ